jgi:hypothetical protein
LIGLQGAQQLDPIVKQKKHGKIAGQAVAAARFADRLTGFRCLDALSASAVPLAFSPIVCAD